MTDITAKLADALREAEDALANSYNVNEWPGDGTSLQDKALAGVRAALTAYTASQSEPEFGPLDPRVHDLGTWEPARDDGWMPIETAPKDGTRVLAIDQNGAPQILSWRQREPYGKPIGNYGWYLGSFKYFGEQTRFLATHWRPLPAPPAPAQEPR